MARRHRHGLRLLPGRVVQNPAFWKFCPDCKKELRREVPVCPECGHEFEANI
jgi:predicted amidophosphoribosyltransferase